jgi:hypothetical protein
MLLRQAFGAGQMIPFNVPGNFFRIKRLTGFTPESLTVEFFRGGAKLPIDLTFSDTGDRARAWPEGFDRVEITSSVAQTVTVQISQGDITSERIQGEVRIIDGAVDRVRGGVAFWGSSATGPVAAQFAHVQLWNPAASGLRLIVHEAQVSVAVAGDGSFRRHNAQLAAAGAVIESKNVGGAAPVSTLMRTENNAALQGTVIASVSLLAAKTEIYKFFDPFIVPPGFGLIFASNVVNVLARGSFQYYEELV